MLTKNNLVPELQKHFSDILGAKVSKEKAWDLFKAALEVPFDTLLANYDKAGHPALVAGQTEDSLVLSLSGVGRFEVIASGSRTEGSVATPRPRFYPSKTTVAKVYKAFGLNPEDAGSEDIADDVPVSEAKAEEVKAEAVVGTANTVATPVSQAPAKKDVKKTDDVDLDDLM